jgi:hypothetical protein
MPPVLIEAYVPGVTLQIGVTVVVLLSLHLAAAVYVALFLSFTDDGPEIERTERVGAGGGVTVGTVQEYAGARPDFSPVLSTVSTVK